MPSITPYEAVKDAILSKQINLSKDRMEVVLVADRYKPNFDSDEKIADLGVTVGDAAVLDQSLRKVGKTRVLFADPVQWEFGKFVSFRYAVIVDRTADVLMACVDFGEMVRVPLFRLEWSGEGIMKL